MNVNAAQQKALTTDFGKPSFQVEDNKPATLPDGSKLKVQQWKTSDGGVTKMRETTRPDGTKTIDVMHFDKAGKKTRDHSQVTNKQGNVVVDREIKFDRDGNKKEEIVATAGKGTETTKFDDQGRPYRKEEVTDTGDINRTEIVWKSDGGRVETRTEGRLGQNMLHDRMITSTYDKNGTLVSEKKSGGAPSKPKSGPVGTTLPKPQQKAAPQKTDARPTANKVEKSDPATELLKTNESRYQDAKKMSDQYTNSAAMWEGKANAARSKMNSATNEFDRQKYGAELSRCEENLGKARAMYNHWMSIESKYFHLPRTGNR